MARRRTQRQTAGPSLFTVFRRNTSFLGCMVSIGALIILAAILAVVFKDRDLPNPFRDKKLPQSYTARSGIKFDYPKGWVVDEIEGSIYLANQPGVPSGASPLAGQVSLTIFPPYPKTLFGNPNAPMIDALRTVGPPMAQSRVLALADPASLTLGGKAAARATLSGAATDGRAYLIDISDQFAVLLFASAPIGEYAQYDQKVRDIAASIRFTAPPAPTPTPPS